MEQAKLLEAHVQLRRMYNLLGEVLDISRQIADALSRNDQVSVQMLIAMREEPLEQIVLTREAVSRQLSTLQVQEAERLRALLNGAPASSPDEKGLADQVAANGRLLKQVQELDHHLNLKIAREKSVYGL